MTREEVIEYFKSLVEVRRKYFDMQTMKDEIECLEMGVKALTAISELSKSLKAVNRYDMDEKVLIGFNMAVAIFNKCFGEIGALKNEQSEQNVGMCQQNVGEMSEKQTDGDLISRTELLNKIWQKEYGKDYDGVNMLDIPHIDIIENMPSADGDLKAEIDKLPRIKVGNSNSPTVKYCIDERLLYEILEKMKGE